MIHRVYLTDDALADLEAIDRYIVDHDGPDKSDHVLNELERAVRSLEQNPDRGALPKELLELGVKRYREVFFKPYRIIYRVDGKKVFVFLIADGRRDMRTLLERRLLGKP